MGWGALCHRLSADYGWTPREIFELTPSEVLVYCERRSGPATVFVSTRIVAEIAAAARERRRAWVERELNARGESQDEASERGPWERLIEWTERERAAQEPSGVPAEGASANDAATTRDGERLRQIYEELRTLRVALTSSAGRAWCGE